MLRIVSVLLIAAACGKSESPPASGAAPGASAASAAGATAASAAPPVALVHATQADLAREVADAARLGNWSEIQHRWQGQTVRWSVLRYRQLCSASDACNVAAFAIQRPAKQGWMPLVAFAPGQYDAMAQACGSREPCEVSIEGTVSELDLSPDLPTRLELSNVRLLPAAAMVQR